MEFENDNTCTEENLLSGISEQTPSKDDPYMHYPDSFQVSPSFQQSQQKQQEINTIKEEYISIINYADQQYKNNEPSFSLNNQSVKQDFCYFQQIKDTLAKLELDLNNQSFHDNFSDIKSNLQELQEKYHQFVIDASDQIVEFQNQQVPFSSGGKHKRTRSEAPPSITRFNVKPKKNETSNLIEKSFDTNIFQKQSEEYSLLLDIIKQDIENIENTKFQEHDQSMELIVHYYKLREMHQNIIQNLQDTNAQLNFTLQEYQQNFDDLASNFTFDIKNFNDQSKVEQVSLVIQKIQEIIQQNQQYEQDLIIQQQQLQEQQELQSQQVKKIEEQQEVQSQQIKKIEEQQNSYDSLLEQFQLLQQEKENQDDVIDSLKQQIQVLQQKSEADQINTLCQNLRELIKYVQDFIILSNKLLQHIYNQSGAKLQFPDNKHVSEVSMTLQTLLQNQDSNSFKKINENLNVYSKEIGVIINQICQKYQCLVDQIIRERKQLMESLQI
ncbi:unnamed protein product [Paramecium octaurelia]|uniref:Uncharacterized protein n=1 Tax=Paramecium octaurelia TaxID=43137 RepID=A0A8S1TF94_PAROT|nr:unnamed protein product [Paramecium octaurelia]